jgi:hypothetical protein
MGSLHRQAGHPPKEWLQKRVTPDDAEAAMRNEATELGLKFSNRWLREWDEFKLITEEGDELWYFEWFPEPLTGAAGYCIIRRGVSVASITTKRA